VYVPGNLTLCVIILGIDIMPNDDPNLECPFCQHTNGQVKAGLRNEVQRYRCTHCNRRYSPQPKHRGIAEEMRQQALELHASGLSSREIGRRLGLKPRSIVNWIHAAVVAKGNEVPNAVNSHGKGTGLPEQQPVATTRRTVRRATIHDVAALAGVSSSTVSNVLNGKGRMSEATRQVIHSAMQQLHFAPNSLMRAIRERKTNILGVVTFGLGNLGDYRRQPIVVDVLGGINREAGPQGYNVLLYTALAEDKSATAGTAFLDGKIDGLLWVGPHSDEMRHAYAAKAGLPVMALLARQEAEGVGYVDVDNIDAIKRVVGHLVEQGNRRIAYAGPTVNQTFLDRLQGYRLGLQAAGIQLDRNLVAVNKAISRSWIPTGVTAEYEATIDRWMAMADPPTAIVLTTDEWASWVISYLEERGIRVPEDVAITGFDDIAHVSNPMTKLTSVSQDFPEIGRLGAMGLINMIEGGSYEDYRTLLPGKLVVRASSLSQRAAGKITQ
jgi:LacI family transcriptional regulator